MNINKWFSGYRTADVDSYVMRLLTGYQQALDSMKGDVETLLSENGRLASQTMSAMEELEALKSRSKVWVAAEADARRTARHIEETARYNAEQTVNGAQVEVGARKAYLATLDAEISKAKREIDDFVESVRAFLGYASQSQKEASPAAGRSPGSAAGKVAGWILGGANADEATATLFPDGLLKIGTSGEDLKIVAQNGAVIGHVSSLVLDGASGKVTGYELGRSAMPDAAPDGTVIPASCVIAVRSGRMIVNTSLLGNLIRPSSLPQAATVEPEPAEVDVARPEETAPRESATPESTEVGCAQEEMIEPQVAPAGGGGRDSEGDVGQAITQRQMTYVIGKVAGRDLTGDDGALIIAKGQEITPEVVERADNQGKLAELIVYMIAPGMSPDEISGSDGPDGDDEFGAEHLVS